MSNYNKATNFAVKDTLTSGDPDKVVSGAEIDNEFNSIASAVTSKADKVAAATTDNLAALDANGNLKDSGKNVDDIIPSGFIGPFAGSTAPSGWILCGGQEVSRSTFSSLFSAIGSTFGNGDGSTTFNVPDLRDRFPLGDRDQGQSDANRVDNFNTALGDSGGSDEHQLSIAEMPSHGHTQVTTGTSGGLIQVSAGGGDIGGQDANSTRSTGGNQPHNNMPPFLALNYIIKT